MAGLLDPDLLAAIDSDSDEGLRRSTSTTSAPRKSTSNFQIYAGLSGTGSTQKREDRQRSGSSEQSKL